MEREWILVKGGVWGIRKGLDFKPSRVRTREDWQQKYFAMAKHSICAVLWYKM